MTSIKKGCFPIQRNRGLHVDRCVEISRRAIGSGGYSYFRVNPGLELYTDNFQVIEAFEMNSMIHGDYYCFAFCLADDMEWEERISGAEISLDRRRGIFYHMSKAEEFSCAVPGKFYKGVNLILSSGYFRDIANDFKWDKFLFTHSKENFKYGYFDFSPRLFTVANQLFSCPFSGRTKTLFMEGKALELTASSMEEIFTKPWINSDMVKSFSPSDREKILLVKDYIDSNYSSNISIRRLSRMFALNEFKLKSGFSTLFNAPVHSYLIDRRMEKAHRLLEERELTVGETAYYVGYSSISSFYKAFKKKFGYNPGACLL